ncbi:MAG: basic amino acid/polyamine antiporter [Clostridiales bacterium]|nr:basic amino acid/polyamine antiporter [Clostridiales bacterium]
MKQSESKQGIKLGFWGLTAIVFAMMVGSGIFNLPQNMATGSGAGAVMIAWVITAAGMMLLVNTFKTLSDRRPDLEAGIYQYAQEGWGNYTGYNVAWGYWLCTAFANVAYAIMLNDTFGAFFPVMMDNKISQVIFGSCIIWLMYAIVGNGLRTAKFINNSLAIIKVLVIIVMIVLMAINFKAGIFTRNFWIPDGGLGNIGTQIKSTMMVSLWCFIGIEGAVMMSAKARKPSDVGKAGITGFSVAWIMYFLVAVLCYGLMNRARLAGLENPSAAYILRETCGEWAYYFVLLAVIISLLGGWVSWTLVCAQVPYEAATVGIFPRRFLKLNSHGTPYIGLFFASLIMQIFLLLVIVAKDVYLAALTVTGMMILPAYLFSGLYLMKSAGKKNGLGVMSRNRRARMRVIGAMCSLFCLWMIYAGGLDIFMSTSVFFLSGIIFYIIARRENNRPVTGSKAPPLFTTGEKIMLAILILFSIITVLSVLNNLNDL